jgi:glycosyltransferase involved in cell wall biosynthesis
VVTVSEASRRGLEGAFRLDGKPIVVVPEGFDREVFHPRRTAEEERTEREALGVGPRTKIILAVGGLSPHKNLDRLVLAVAQLAREGPERDLHLVFAGADRGEDVFFSSRDHLVRLVGENGLAKRVTFTGFVPDARLGALYRAASVLAFPSLLEGFGLPALEAMACGTPVAASRRGSLPEILGAAGFFFDPESTEDAARALATALDDRGARERAVAEGLEIATRFSWEAAAKKLLAEFGKLSGERP